MISKRTLHGPHIWALAREGYLAGETARSLSQRLGPSVDAIRGRIYREDWSKATQARALEVLRYGRATVEASAAHTPRAAVAASLAGRAPEPEPEAPFSQPAPYPPINPRRAVQAATRRAAAALAAGRPDEAASLIKAAEGMTRLSRQIGPLVHPEPPASPEDAALFRAAGMPVGTEAWDSYMDAVYATAADLFMEMMSPDPEAAMLTARLVFAWRQDHRAPHLNDRDFVRAQRDGWWARVFDSTGAVLPLPTGVKLRRAIMETLGLDENGAAHPCRSASS